VGKGDTCANSDTWVIVPAFNEAPVVGAVVRGLREHFPNVVGVDDGSTDDTAAEMRAHGARVVRHAVNLGAGAATQTGLNFAMLDPGARYFVTFDADGQHLARDAASMVDRLREGEHHILLGSRFLGSADGLRPGRRALLSAARTFEWASSGIRLTDAHNGLRAFSREFGAYLNLSHADFAHASQLLEQVHRSKLSYAEHPVTVMYSDYSRAKGQRSINSVNIAVDVWLRRLLRNDH
jgi:glycosyltransferase involved in cell wall biosynthesis